ncbi:alpha-(1,3)-fucosyltransferase 11-like [Watersipora subatra]|uniref:alpha-(1,3)-fucosyltransferase 11-like n=1 Tax=Watersipora subatra TaxID=2589382 RepID=UPI00355AD9F3
MKQTDKIKTIQELNYYARKPGERKIRSAKHVCRYEFGVRNSSEADITVFCERAVFTLKRPPHKKTGDLWAFYSKEPQARILDKTIQSNWDGLFNYSITYDRKTEESYHVFRPRLMKITEPKTKFYRPYPKMREFRGLLLNSHCTSPDDFRLILSAREQYILELAKYMPVDLYTAAFKNQCREALKDMNGNIYVGTQPNMKNYMFYMAFENNLCKDYISEKFWKILIADSLTIPIALGGLSIEEYSSIAPPNSFIHVRNFTSPAALAKHLKLVSENENAFNYYHEWRNNYKLDTNAQRSFHGYRSLGYYGDYMEYICDLAYEKPHKVWETFSKDYTPNDCIDISKPEDHCVYYNLTCTIE